MSKNSRYNLSFEDMPNIFDAPTKSNFRGKSIDEALKIVFKQMEVAGNRQRTIDSYEYIFTQYAEYNKITHLEEINRDTIFAYLSSLENVKDSTRLIRLKSLKAVLGKFYNNGWLKDKFWTTINIKIDKQVKKGTEKADIERLIILIDKTTFVGFRDACAIILLYKTGIRIRTLGELREHHIDFERKMLTLDGGVLKNHKILKLPFDEDVGIMLKMLLELNKDVLKSTRQNNDYVFITQNGNKINSGKSTNCAISKRLHYYAKEFGLENINAHALRRAFAKGLHEKGASVAIISKALGHSDLSVTTQYLDISADEVAQNLREFI